MISSLHRGYFATVYSLYINNDIIRTQCSILLGNKPKKVQFVLLSQYEILLYTVHRSGPQFKKRKQHSQSFYSVQDINPNGWLFSVTAGQCFAPVSPVLVLGVLIWFSVLCLESLCTKAVTLSDYRPLCLRRACHLWAHKWACVCVCVESEALVFSPESLTEAPVGAFVVVSWRGLRGSGLCMRALERDTNSCHESCGAFLCNAQNSKGFLTWFQSGCCFKFSGNG